MKQPPLSGWGEGRIMGFAEKKNDIKEESNMIVLSHHP